MTDEDELKVLLAGYSESRNEIRVNQSAIWLDFNAIVAVVGVLLGLSSTANPVIQREFALALVPAAIFLSLHIFMAKSALISHQSTYCAELEIRINDLIKRTAIYWSSKYSPAYNRVSSAFGTATLVAFATLLSVWVWATLFSIFSAALPVPFRIALGAQLVVLPVTIARYLRELFSNQSRNAQMFAAYEQSVVRP